MGKAAGAIEDDVTEAEIAQVDRILRAVSHSHVRKGKMPVHKALDPRIKASNSQEGPRTGPKAAVAETAPTRAGHVTETVLAAF